MGAAFISFDKLTFKNDFIFCHTLEANADLCKELAELATERKIDRIVEVEQQKSIKESIDGKGVRFDVVFRDDMSTVYDVEMQTSSGDDLPRRARYYQSMSDLETLRKGKEYRSLKNTYIIFICTFDPFNKGRARYVAKTYIKGHGGAAYDDGTEKIFLNTQYRNMNVSKGLKSFLDYLDTGSVSNDFTRQIEEAVINLKRESGRRDEYMTLCEQYDMYREEGYNDGRTEGVKEGRKEAEIEDIKKMREKLSDEEILAMGFSEERLKEARSEQA